MADKEKVEMLNKDIELQKSIAEVGNSKGGKILTKSLLKDVIDSIEKLGNNHSKMSLQEFVSLGAKVRANLDLLQVISRSEGNLKYYQDLLEEELQGTE